MRYEDFTIRIFASRDGGYDLSVESPEGSAQAHVKLPSELTSSAVRLSGNLSAARSSGSREFEIAGQHDTSPAEFGSSLYESLFSGGVARLYDRSYAALKDPEAGLRIRLHLNLEDPEVAKLAEIPWEYVYEKDSMEHLALSRQTPIVRYVDVPRRPSLLAFDGTLRVLVVMSSPAGTHPLDLAKERQLIASSWAKEKDVKVDFLEHPTGDTLFAMLVREKYHVLHYMGHGTYDEKSGSGALILESEDGQPALLGAETLGTWLRDAPSLRLAFLNACDTGRTGKDQPFAGVATRLVMAGLPAVVAMQSPISDGAAIDFARAFYPRLAAGYGVDEASAQGRKAILSSSKQSTEWAIPVVYMRAPDGRLFDTPVPQAAASSSGRGALFGAAAATLVILLAFFARTFLPETELEFALDQSVLTMTVGDEDRVLLTAQNLSDSDVLMAEYVASVEFENDALAKTHLELLTGENLEMSEHNGVWQMDIKALNAGTVPLKIVVDRPLTSDAATRTYDVRIDIKEDADAQNAYTGAKSNFTNTAISTSALIKSLKSIDKNRLSATEQTEYTKLLADLTRLNEMRDAAMQSAASTSASQLEKAQGLFGAWVTQYGQLRGDPLTAQNKETAQAVSKQAQTLKTLTTIQRCLSTRAPQQLSGDLFIQRNGAVVDNHCYYLAPGKQNCTSFCAGVNRQCDVRGLHAAAASVAKCTQIVKSIGSGGTFQEVKAKSGTYRDDLSGCTFGDWAKTTAVNGVLNRENRWIQVMRRGDKPPTCDAVNADASRMRVCACE